MTPPIAPPRSSTPDELFYAKKTEKNGTEYRVCIDRSY
jgi:hypothetical protein